jgi:general secretion pathway protein N
MRRPPRPQPSLRAPRGWALAGALCGLVAATVIWAPAAWLARGVDSATQGQVLLQQPRGTLWNGSASLVFTGGAGSRDRTALPTRLEWTLRPRLDGARIQLRSECCTPTALVLDLLPRWQGLNAVVHDSDTRWPASLLAGLGTPWNTVDLQGQLRLATQALQLQLSTLAGDLRLSGQGQWVGQRLHFQGEASASPERETALSNLLNILGRRQGPRSIISFG